ncbi:MAG: response regulator [Balneolales bacterium]
MKNKAEIYILIVEDEAGVLSAIVRDMEYFEEQFPIEMTESVEEARDVVKNILDHNGQLGLVICDHILPGTHGADFLVELQNDEKTAKAMNVLLTGQAGLDETIKAINEGGLKHFIAKPWDKDELINISIKLLTDYVIQNENDLLPYMKLLDQERIAAELHKGSRLSDR